MSDDEDIELPTTPVTTQLVPVLVDKEGNIEAGVEEIAAEIARAIQPDSPSEDAVNALERAIDRMERRRDEAEHVADAIQKTPGLLYRLSLLLDTDEATPVLLGVLMLFDRCAGVWSTPHNFLATAGTAKGTTVDIRPSLFRLAKGSGPLASAAACCALRVVGESCEDRKSVV